MCFVFISEQIATCATYSEKCLQRGTDWVFNLLALEFYI